MALVAAVVMLGGCGGSSGTATSTDSNTPTGTLSSQGVAVDPYIVGAVFQEVAADSTVLQNSSASDANGKFEFPAALTEGSTIMTKASATGTHNGVPYTGILKRKVSGSDGTWVVSPLTTLTASGLSDQQVVDLFAAAGLSGLTAADITADPMSGIADAASISADTNLIPLQANMAVNAMMAALGSYQVDPSTISDADHAALLKNMVTAVTDIVSQSTYQSLANDPSVATSSDPMTVADFIQTATNLCQAISNSVRQSMASNGTLPSANAVQTIIDNTVATAPAVAHQYYANRVGEVPAPDGATLYAQYCAGCHNALESSSKANATAAQIQSAIASVSSMQSISLTAAEIQAIADALVTTTTPTPTPTPDGATLYADNCAVCHGALASSNVSGVTAAQIQSAMGTIGTMKSLSLTTAEIQAIADVLATSTTPTPTPTPDGAALYASDCAACHGALASSTKAGATAAQIQAGITNNYGGMGSISLTTAEIQAIADALATSTTPTPTPTPDGATLYGSNCATCHGVLASSAKAGATATQIQAAITANTGGMGSLNLTTAEIQSIADALAQVVPAPVLDGATLYATYCASCHGDLANSTKAGATAAQIEAAIAGNTGGMNSITLTTEQIQAIADVLPAAQPTPTPTPGTIDGAALYASDCAGCHQPLASTTKPGRTAAQITAAIASVSSMQSISLTADQIQAIADVLPPDTSGTPSGPDYSDCTACHGQPPNGTAYPNEAGAHAVHQALAGVGTDCSVCHSGAAHNGTIDISIKSTYNAKSGTAGLNTDGTDTCVNVSCHGGKTTPDWFTGGLNVNTDCTSCHASGTSQYNSYNSGKHGDHRSRACTACHNTSTLAVNHFSRLDTTTMEGPASSTIGGGSTSISSYNATTKVCVGCHGQASWTGGGD